MKKAIVISLLIILPLLVYRFIKAQNKREEEMYIKAKKEILRMLQNFYVAGDYNNLAQDMTGKDAKGKTDILIRKAIFIKMEIDKGKVGNEVIPQNVWIKLRYDLTEK